ncbi:polyketide synthase [Exophiala xenobiotica]|nr:polyketide synthase [Exophiala xenobiotica]KAK5250261.1 polyketide synthase [Exophiala xenobiotica]KAK5390702.1 polyketide synthase [Exophiala xenobiotica]KAK5407986.1 polyketide synthase [Exophiala xenobiotica]
MREIIIFADQTASSHAVLQEACKRRDQSLLQQFLRQTAEALRRETYCRFHTAGCNIGFSSTEELIQGYYACQTTDAAFDCALVCMAQLAHFIGTFERRSPSYPRQTPEICLVGVGIGLIVANAVASADSLPSLIPLAVETVLIAFRLGAHLQLLTAQLLHNPLGPSWSRTLKTDEKSAIALLETFHDESNTHAISRLRLSVVTPDFVVISGSPMVLDRFVQDSGLCSTWIQNSNNVYEPYHAMHRIPDFIIEDDILLPTTRTLFHEAEPRMPFFCGTKAKPLGGFTPLESLASALKEITTSTVEWTELFRGKFPRWRQTVNVLSTSSRLRSSSIISNLSSRNFNVELEDISDWIALGVQDNCRVGDPSIIAMLACVELEPSEKALQTSASSDARTGKELFEAPPAYTADSGYVSKSEKLYATVIEAECLDLPERDWISAKGIPCLA